MTWAVTLVTILVFTGVMTGMYQAGRANGRRAGIREQYDMERAAQPLLAQSHAVIAAGLVMHPLKSHPSEPEGSRYLRELARAQEAMQ